MEKKQKEKKGFNRNKIALYKAMRFGKEKVLYISTPVGRALGRLIPKVDKCCRLVNTYFYERVINEEEYKKYKNILYNYINGLERWTNSLVDKVVAEVKKKVKKENKSYILDEVEFFTKKYYLNTAIAEDFFNVAKTLDSCFKILIIATRYKIISDVFLDEVTGKLNLILKNFEEDLTRIGVALWKAKNNK